MAYSQSNSAKFPINEETGLITYREVVTEEGTKEQFFNRAVGWINQYYPNPVDVTKTRDLETGIIKGLHRFKIYNTDPEGNKTDAGIVQYEFALEFKEGRYRFTLTDFALKDQSKIPVEKWLDKKDPQYVPVWESYLNQLYDFSKEWIENLKDGMKPKGKINDDQW
jgi:hypothetical protein